MGMTPGEKKAWNKGFEEGANSVEEGLPGWFGTFADMMTLLFAFFVLLAAISTMDPVKLQEMANSQGKSLGRLVLADALTYTEKKFKPKLIVDLATLTGAIIVSLGSEYAGLFSNNDKLSNQLIDAGNKVDEKLWRMPLHKNFDKLMNSKNADMQNINYVGGAGSTTAAQFLQRFILNKTPWAHLDIAGMAFSKYGGALNSGGATGYGVRLLNKLVEDYYE